MFSRQTLSEPPHYICCGKIIPWVKNHWIPVPICKKQKDKNYSTSSRHSNQEEKLLHVNLIWSSKGIFLPDIAMRLQLHILGPRSTVSFLCLWVSQRSNPSYQTPSHKGRAWPWVKELQGIEATYVIVYIHQSTKCKIWALVIFILLQSPLVLLIFYARFCNCNLIASKFYT